jgi:hypothetical protein
MYGVFYFDDFLGQIVHQKSIKKYYIILGWTISSFFIF